MRSLSTSLLSCTMPNDKFEATLVFMEPIERIISFLREKIPEVDRELEEPIKNLLSKFEMIQKHEYEAHMEILKSLEAQILELEERVQSLESSKKP